MYHVPGLSHVFLMAKSLSLLGGQGKHFDDTHQTHMSDSVFDEECKSGLSFALQPSLHALHAKTHLKTQFFHSSSETKHRTEKLTQPRHSAHSTYPTTQLSTKSVTKRCTSIFNIMKFAKCREKRSRFFWKFWFFWNNFVKSQPIFSIQLPVDLSWWELSNDVSCC